MDPPLQAGMPVAFSRLFLLEWVAFKLVSYTHCLSCAPCGATCYILSYSRPEGLVSKSYVKCVLFEYRTYVYHVTILEHRGELQGPMLVKMWI